MTTFDVCSLGRISSIQKNIITRNAPLQHPKITPRALLTHFVLFERNMKLINFVNSRMKKREAMKTIMNDMTKIAQGSKENIPKNNSPKEM